MNKRPHDDWMIPMPNRQPDQEEERRTVLLVAGYSRGAEDLLDLLWVLGLSPETDTDHDVDE